jgi:DNA-binding CsgD family transcriptional regulator
VYHFSAADKVVTAAEKYGRINRVSLTSRGDSAIFTSNFLQRKADIEIPYRENSVKITYGMPTQNNAYVDGYKYRINKGEWSDITLSNIKEYTNLSEGTYTFEVVALLTTGQTATDSITFKILPPWYRSTAAKIIYIVLVIVAIWLLYMLSNKRIAKAAHKVEIAKDAELKEKDDEIHQLEKLQLKSEIEHKSQEIVNLLLSVSNKHEVLINIKEELQKVRSNLKGDITNRKLLIALQEQIDTALQSEKVLDRIDKEFDLVHNDFTKKLRADYPDLTSNEVKMCSYIKMNLSTKEIAPLMNMSMRGVETIRYRMRKKFGLERSDSLTEFIRRR